MPSSNLFSRLFTAAEAYFSLGYAVIPLHGDADPSRAKVAAVPWGSFQQVKPTLQQLQGWFLDDDKHREYAALGIVTGTVSRLVVLDFDTPEYFSAFQSRFPDLCGTHVIQTRRGFHIYFRMPSNLRVASRKGQGIDLLSDGCYAVARPSTIAGHTYKLVQGGQPRVLSLPDLHTIRAFIDSYQPPVSSFQLSSQTVSPSSNSVLCTLHSEPPSDSVPSTQHLALPALYRYLAAKGEGRNRALFSASLAARDHGWSLEKTLGTLVDLHTAQRTSPTHAAEAPDIRRREAENTIRSAYTRPARPLRPHKRSSGEKGGADGLPNSVREKLLGRKCTHAMRVWEGLNRKSIHPGTIFTAEQAVTLLQGIVGRDSVYNSLNSLVNGEPLFERLSPSGHPQASDDAAVNTKNGNQKKMRFW